MKVLSLTEPYATLIKEKTKKSKQEVGKLLIEVNCIFTPVVQEFLKNMKKIKN